MGHRPQICTMENAGETLRYPMENARWYGMRRNDVQDELQEGFEIGPLPAVGPDGAPDIPPLRDIPPPRPRLCEAGPCRNYHQFVIQLDA